jgi:multiple sugar transport system substrate-binding protein
MKNSKQLGRMPKFRRRLGFVILRLLIPFLIGITLLFSLPALTQQPVTVTVLINALEAAQWVPLVKEFEAKNPDIRLQLIEGPNATDLIENLYTSAFLLGESPYDIVYMDIIWTPKFAAAGWLMDLSNRISSNELAQFLPEDVNGGRYKGGLYRIPVRSDVGMLYYRKDLLEQGGYQPPKTFTQLMQTSQASQKQRRAKWGYLWEGRQYEGVSATFVEVLKGYGGFWIDPNTNVVGLDQPAAVQAVEFLRDTIQQGVSPAGVTTYGEEEVRHLFQNGAAAFMRSWPYAWPLGNAPDSPIRGKFGIEPMVHALGKSSGGCKGGWGLGIAKTTKHPEAAWRMIEFFSSEAAQRQLILATGYVPSRRSLFNDPQIVAKYSYYPALLEIVEKSVLRPPIPQYDQASAILQRYLSAAFTGQLSSERAMKAAANETRALLGNNR